MVKWRDNDIDGGGGGIGLGHLEDCEDNENANSSDSKAFGLKELHRLLESSPEEVLLAIGEKSEEWSALLESNEVTDAAAVGGGCGDKFLLIIQILDEKVCTDLSKEFQQHQVDALIAMAFSRPLIKKLEELISSDGSATTTPAEVNPLKLLQTVYNILAFVLKTMPSIAMDHLFKMIKIGLEQSLLYSDSEPDISRKFQDLFQSIAKLFQEERAATEKAKGRRTGRRQFNDADMAAFDKEIPPNTIEEIDVIPSLEELLETYSKAPPFLRPNKPTGAYNNCKHYLDVQFRLLREDFVAPLRRGLKIFMEDRKDYISGRKRMPMGEIRVYRNVTMVGREMMRDVIAYKLQLPLNLYAKINWGKRLQGGNLIILTTMTPDNCLQIENTHFGVVLHREDEESDEGIIKVDWVGSPPRPAEMGECLLFESEVYLEAYRHTLEALKGLDLEWFPMKSFIVDSSNIVKAPRYLQQNRNPNLNLRCADGSFLEINPLENSQWPAASELGFDSNQFQAFRAALTKEFTIIQGPPGTGKTFLGLQIAKTLLSNLDLWRDYREASPMLVVCYTNHALDQFLEGILKFYEEKKQIPNIVRVGGRSESEALKEYGLKVVRMEKRKAMEGVEKGYAKRSRTARNAVRNMETETSYAAKDIKGLGELQGLVDFPQLRVWCGKLQKMYPKYLWDKLKDLQWLGFEAELFTSDETFKADTVIRKWFHLKKESNKSVVELWTANTKVFFSMTDRIPVSVPTNTQDDEDDDELDGWVLQGEFFVYKTKRRWQSRNAELEPLKCIENCSIDSCYKSIKIISKLLTVKNNPAFAKWRESQPPKMVLEKRKQLLEQIFYYHRAEMLDLPDVSEKLEKMKEQARTGNGDLGPIFYENLSMAERWAVYFGVIEEALNLAIEDLETLELSLVKLHQQLKEVKQWGDGLILKGADVVGMTTTGAAKNSALLSAMKSKIVIVEEAAEVFEAHVVTCLTEHCQQLILIGDHKQLRPTPNVYELAIKYNLDLSFFERMINNDLHCYPLKIQHRMRPEIAELVKDTIYDELANDTSVYLYPDVLGITKNVFFITHSEKEESQHDSLSKSNLHEARFIAALCRHLILQGYEPTQITILSTYIGQMNLIRKEVSVFEETCEGVRITCVDNFQGEENDIILLSLVRSNDEQKIGFVGIDNRICVSLSRARHGLYVIGNMQLLFEQSKTWAAIKRKLEKNESIGESLQLVCECHETKSWVKTGKDILKVAPEGGCTLWCNTLLKCGHTCPLASHPDDKDHEKFRCHKKCRKLCKVGHPCEAPCYKECPSCVAEVEKELHCEWNESEKIPAHTKMMHCFEDVEQVVCHELVEKNLPCGHIQSIACCLDVKEYKCDVSRVKKLPCGHENVVQCHKFLDFMECATCKGGTPPYGERQEVIKENCGVLVPAKNKPLCGHSDILVPSKSENASPVEITKLCKKPCEFQFKSCGHTCRGNCSACLHGRLHLKCETKSGSQSHQMKADSIDAGEIQAKLISDVIGSPEVDKLFPEVVRTLKSYLFSTVTVKRGKFLYENVTPNKDNLPDKFSMMSLDYMGGKALDAASILEKDLKDRKLLPSHYNDVREKYRETIGKMLERHPLTRQEVEDLNREFLRLDYFRQLKVRRSLSNYDPSNAETYGLYERAEKCLASVLPLTNLDKTVVESCLRELDEKLQ